MQAIVDNLIHDTFGVSLPLYWPELVLCATIVLLLLVRLFDRLSVILPPFLVAVVGTMVALAMAAPADGFSELASLESTEMFTGMLVYDGLTVFLRLLLLTFALLVILLCRLTDLTTRFDAQDIYVLLLGATLGMCIMASANHLMTIFLGVEMASVPSYVLVGLVRYNRRASEAALKYAVYGAGAAGIMLYGITLLAGLLGTAHLPTIGLQLVNLDLPGLIATGQDLGVLAALVLAGLLIGVGLAFKLSAVPFHFWCPDAFEGATAEVAGFLSIASKAAALALLVRVVTAGCIPQAPTDATIAQAYENLAVVSLADSGRVDAKFVAPQQNTEPLSPVRTYLTVLIAIVSLVTCTFGNLAAYGQSNIKRMMAYSTIAHAGYMMMPVAAMAALTDPSRGEASDALSALLVYMGIYMFMNLSAFAIVAFLRNATGSERIDDYAGIVRSAPVTTVCMIVVLASLVGIPPLAGFLSKFAAFAVLAQVGTPLMLGLLVCGGLNTVVSLVYYWRVAKTMVMRPAPASRGPVQLSLAPVSYVVLVSIPLFLLFVFPTTLFELAQHAAAGVLP